jgi:hypothetical protein
MRNEIANTPLNTLTPETDAAAGNITGVNLCAAFETKCRQLEIERNEALRELDKARTAARKLRDAFAKWRDMPSEEMRLRAGDMTAQEIRSVKAVLNAILLNV